MKNVLIELLGKMLAYHYYESGRKFDWYTWGCLTFSTGFLTVPFLIPGVYVAFKEFDVDFTVKSEMRKASMITAAIVFCLIRFVLFLTQKPLLAQCQIELELTPEKKLKTYFVRIGFGVAIAAVVVSIATGLIFRMAT